MIPDDLRFSTEHEWVRVLDAVTVRIGITDHAQDQLGDVVFVELPDVGTAVELGAAFGEVESTKSTSDLVAPVSGAVVGVNGDLVDRPELVNADPYGAGWLVEVRVDDAAAAAAELLDAAGYAAAIG
jgi:glycine cleavage system H protein